MIVEAVDGKFYLNPVIDFGKWLLVVNEDGVFIKREGKVTWSTARRPLAGVGVKCHYVEKYGHESIILHERLVLSTVFMILLKKPIPIPTSHSGVLTYRPNEIELEGRELLVWTKAT